MVVDSAGDNLHFVWSFDYFLYDFSSESVCVYVVLITVVLIYERI